MRETKRQILSGVEDINTSKIVDNNTVEIGFKNGDRAVRLHNTNIVTFTVDGKIILTSGGWRTSTTKDRLNGYSPFNIYQKNSIWYVETPKGTFNFYDGITFDYAGNLVSENKNIDLKAVNKVKRDIKKYVNLLDKVEKLPEPSGADCWYCHFRSVGSGKPLGDLTEGNTHLQDHIKEGYIHGSILVNAMREYGYRDNQIGFHYQADIRDTFKRALRKYLYKRLVSTI